MSLWDEANAFLLQFCIPSAADCVRSQRRKRVWNAIMMEDGVLSAGIFKLDLLPGPSPPGMISLFLFCHRSVHCYKYPYPCLSKRRGWWRVKTSQREAESGIWNGIDLKMSAGWNTSSIDSNYLNSKWGSFMKVKKLPENWESAVIQWNKKCKSSTQQSARGWESFSRCYKDRNLMHVNRPSHDCDRSRKQRKINHAF